MLVVTVSAFPFFTVYYLFGRWEGWKGKGELGVGNLIPWRPTSRG